MSMLQMMRRLIVHGEIYLEEMPAMSQSLTFKTDTGENILVKKESDNSKYKSTSFVTFWTQSNGYRRFPNSPTLMDSPHQFWKQSSKHVKPWRRSKVSILPTSDSFDGWQECIWSVVTEISWWNNAGISMNESIECFCDYMTFEEREMCRRYFTRESIFHKALKDGIFIYFLRKSQCSPVNVQC